MMTGDEHRVEAERLLALAAEHPSPHAAMNWTAQASVHATLAVADSLKALRPTVRLR